ncbi:MAG: MraY family glycosyltransferase [Patescibacteria group bacterium]|jgi:UDP-GlcNAc:undecaprenyl-phosphate GlcNAc-1-phosphate transferase
MSRDSLVLYCIAAVLITATFSYLFGFISAKLAKKFGAIDTPVGGRKIHKNAIPLWGGVGIAVSILLGMGLLALVDGFYALRSAQLLGICAAVLILAIGGLIDDRRPLPPIVQLLFPMIASVIVIVTGTGIVQITDPLNGGGFSLAWWKIGSLSLPADLITLGWLLAATYATKFLDGLDGLVSGMAVIGSAMVGALTLSPTFYQPAVALLASVMGGGFAGFLPHNVHPARQFLGEAGSTVAGFLLGVLAIVSSAKIAIALAVLAIPVMDAAIVIVGRMARGTAPWKGDDTHLHFRLLKAGIPHRRVVLLLWGVSFAAGLIALTLQTRGKLFLVVALAVFTVLASWFAKRIGSRRVT